MKNLTTIFMIAVALILGQASHAQQWSDVSLGISPSPQYSNTHYSYTMDMDIYNGVPYVLIHITGNALAVMYYSAGVWTTLPTPTPPAHIGATGAKIAIDASGNVYVAFYSQAANSLFVKKYNGTSWVGVGAQFFASNDGPQDLIIDPSTNFPIIVTRNQTGTFKLSAYRFDGTNWNVIGALGFSPTINYCRVAISPTGTPYVVFDAGGGKFSVMKFDGANWVLVGASAFGDFSVGVAGTDIAVDASGAPYVITQSTATTLKSSVLKYNGTAWVNVGAADFTPGAANQPRFMFNGTGSLHMVFQDAASSNKISVMRFNGTSWVAVGSLALSGGGGRFPIIDFDAANTPFVLFHDAQLSNNNGTLMKLCSSTAATVTSTTPGSTCGPGSVTVSAAGTGTFRWYNSSGLYIAGGANFQLSSLATTTTVSVAAYDANGCSTARTQVVATVNEVPTITASTDGSRCGSGTVSISATPSVGNVQWFAATTGGSTLGTGNSFTSPSISTTTTYFAEANNSGCLSTARTSVVATVKAIPTANIGIGNVRCGGGSMDISAAAFPNGATLNWFAASSGGTTLGTGLTFTTPNISTTTTYHAEAFLNGCSATSRLPVVAEVRTIPTVTSTTPGVRCGDGTVSLSSTVSNSAVARWYDAPTGGTSIGNALSYTTPSLATTTTYYVEAFLNACASTTRTAVVATVNPIPSLFSSDVTRCDAGTVSFEAASTGTVSWFAASTGGSALGTGASFTTPIISVTTPYFAEATLNGCTTPSRIQVQGIVVATPPKPTITQNNSNLEAPVLTSSASTGNQWYKNGSLIGGAIANTFMVADAGEYSVQVNNQGCLSPFSDLILYVITGFEVADGDLLKLYPNPTADELFISLRLFDDNKIVNIALVDMMGRKLNQTIGIGGDEVVVNVRSFHAGQYLVLAQQGNRKIVRKFIKSSN